MTNLPKTEPRRAKIVCEFYSDLVITMKEDVLLLIFFTSVSANPTIKQKLDLKAFRL